MGGSILQPRKGPNGPPNLYQIRISWTTRKKVCAFATATAPWTPFKVFGSFAEIRPLSERPLKPPPQLICLSLRELPEVLFKFTLHFVPGAFDLKLVHRSSDILESDCSIQFSSRPFRRQFHPAVLRSPRLPAKYGSTPREESIGNRVRATTRKRSGE
jgi:hypothetical protein